MNTRWVVTSITKKHYEGGQSVILNVELCNKHMREIRDFTLTSEIIEESIKKYPYTGEKRIKDPVAENALLPPIILPFYSYIFEFGKVPSPDELVNLYLKQEHFSEDSNRNITVSYRSSKIIVKKEGLTARILRTYPSILRDVHFYCMAVESNFFQIVWYSFAMDYENGIDIRVKYCDKWYNIALLQDTVRSRAFKTKKPYRHLDMNNKLIYINLKQTLSKRCGDYNLYTFHHVEQLKQELNEKL